MRTALTPSAHVKQFPAICRNRTSLTLTATAVITLPYRPAFAFTGIGDDYICILGNPKLQSAPFWEALSERMNGYQFLPQRELSVRQDWQLAESAVLAHHLHNLLGYVASCFVAVFCAKGLLALTPSVHRTALRRAVFRSPPLHCS